MRRGYKVNATFGKDVTSGSMPRQMLRLALPILIGNVLTTGYSIINTIWVGNLLGKDAVAAVAVSFPIFLGMVALCSGATFATSILISRAYGAKDSDAIQRIVNHSWTIAIAMMVIVLTSGLLLAESMLKLLGTPEEIMRLAADYLRLTVIGFAGLYASYLIASILRGIGDTAVPLGFIILSTVINALLDPILIIGLGPIPRMGLDGAAAASLVSSGLSTLLGFLYVRVKYKREPINPTRLGLKQEAIMEIVKLGIPSFIQQMLVSMGYAFTIIFVSPFGASSIAAFGIASRLDSIVAMPAIAVMMAVSTLTAQSIGANKSERIPSIFSWGIRINFPLIAMVSLLCFAFPNAIMRIFVKEADVIEAGINYLRIVGLGYLFLSVFYVSNGIINGAGKTVATMVISFISLCVIRLPLAGGLSQTSLGIRGVWVAIIISFVITTGTSLLYYKFGRWHPEQTTGKRKKRAQEQVEGL